jgi:hypothetical protein
MQMWWYPFRTATSDRRKESMLETLLGSDSDEVQVRKTKCQNSASTRGKCQLVCNRLQNGEGSSSTNWQTGLRESRATKHSKSPGDNLLRSSTTGRGAAAWHRAFRRRHPKMIIGRCGARRTPCRASVKTAHFEAAALEPDAYDKFDKRVAGYEGVDRVRPKSCLRMSEFPNDERAA